MTRRNWIAALLATTAVAVTVSVLAHDTPNTRRSPADCASLPPGERAACVACVTRPRPHHFHPLEAAGTRCDPSDGVRR